MVTTNVVVLRLLDERPDTWLLQVLNLVFIGGGQMGDHRSVVAGDDDTATTSRLRIVDTVFSVDTSLVASLLEDIGILVTADAPDVEHGVRGEHVLDRSSEHFPTKSTL